MAIRQKWMTVSVLGLLCCCVAGAGASDQATTRVSAGDLQPARNFFERKFGGSRTGFTGHVGYEFTTEVAFVVTALGRSVSGEALRGSHTVTLWSTTDQRKLASVVMTPKSRNDGFGFAYEVLPQSVKLEGGRTYRITSSEEKGGDPMVDLCSLGSHLGVATIQSGIYSENDAFPTTTYGGENQGYGVPTFFIDPAGLDASLLKVSTAGPKPFSRELSTGYLLNCSFLSPRPYCWPKRETVMLSGWDVDKSGGDFEYKPTGELGQDFAFHSEWFKLVDKSTTASVTLKHQIARQTQGQLTLEFRFRLPVVMEEASWQLRDLDQDQAGVSLLVKGGNLCWGSGQLVVPLEANRDYGVKVVADITGRTADVYVDGELKAKAIPFVNPIKSVDWFLVTTGDAATGELFLNPVNIHKGYRLNETFVTCATDKSPSDWKLSGAKVEKFECATNPDIFSLKVDGEASRTIGAWSGKTVFECKFLLPGESEGVTIDLGGLHLEKLVRYRSNFWYMAKLVADPGTRTADVYLNGKLLEQKLSFAKAGDALHFAGKLWVDDLLVYPWSDYPADYVPEPKPMKASHILGVQSCNLWREGTAYAGWDYVRPFAKNRKPYLGWYDEGNPEQTDWEIKWLVEHGVTFEQHCWYRPNNAINNPIKDGVLDQGIVKGLFNARYGNLKKFTIMYTDEGACETNPKDWRENVVPYIVEYFFKDSRYLKIDGRPVFSIYQQATWIRMFGGDEGARQALQLLRDEVAKAGFPGIYVLMEERNANRGVLQKMKSIGVDYCYAYTWGTPNAGTQRSKNMAQRDAAGAAGLGMLPSISMGWAREPWGVRDGGFMPPAEYKGLAQWARDEFMPGLPADSLGRRVVMLANWNEFGEGHFLMPSTLAGFAYLDALRDVFTAGGTHEDAVPTEPQKKRFNVLFPRD